MRVALLILLAGCTSTPTGTGPDAGADAAVDHGVPIDNDGSVAADLGGASCDQVAKSVMDWWQAHQACNVDADCIWYQQTACGLTAQCGGFVNRAAPGAYLDSLLDAWHAMQCEPVCQCPKPDPGVPACLNGACGARPTGTGNVGDDCLSGADCKTGECVGPVMSKLFFGGYCTYFDCDQRNLACPTGSTCKAVGDGHFYCLKDCNPNLGMPQCRDGYACCSGPGPQGDMGWCAPNMSALCLAN